MKPGDLDDPVAQNIRREQQRDAMPSAAEAKRDHEAYLADQECQFCGEDDAERLELVLYGYHECPEFQAPPHPEEVVTCEDCGFDADFYGTWKSVDWMRHRLQEYAGFVTYECRMTEHAEIEEPERQQIEVGTDPLTGEPIYEDGPPVEQPRPTVPFQCRCGADVAFIVTLPVEVPEAERSNGGYAGP